MIVPFGEKKIKISLGAYYDSPQCVTCDNLKIGGLKMSKNVKKRNWTFVLYPESAPEDWLDIIIQRGIVFAISPLHDKDVNPTGEVKKPHYHVILCYDGPTTYNSVCELVQDTLNQPIPKVLDSVKGMYRYFTHKDNPEKYQYNEKDIKVYNGFDVNDMLSSFEVFQNMKLVQAIIIENNFLEYSILMDYLLTTEQMELWSVACSHTLYFNSYICSRRNNLKDELRSVKK